MKNPGQTELVRGHFDLEFIVNYNSNSYLFFQLAFCKELHTCCLWKTESR